MAGSLFVLVTAALILAGPEVYGRQVTELEIAAGLAGMLALVTAPLVICGFRTWKWNSEVLEFIVSGGFRPQRLQI
jgi:hypothetical protein